MSLILSTLFSWGRLHLGLHLVPVHCHWCPCHRANLPWPPVRWFQGFSFLCLLYQPVASLLPSSLLFFLSASQDLVLFFRSSHFFLISAGVLITPDVTAFTLVHILSQIAIFDLLLMLQDAGALAIICWWTCCHLVLRRSTQNRRCLPWHKCRLH